MSSSSAAFPSIAWTTLASMSNQIFKKTHSYLHQTVLNFYSWTFLYHWQCASKYLLSIPLKRNSKGLTFLHCWPSKLFLFFSEVWKGALGGFSEPLTVFQEPIGLYFAFGYLGGKAGRPSFSLLGEKRPFWEIWGVGKVKFNGSRVMVGPGSG